VVGCREVVRDGIQGFLVPPHDIAQIADRLVQLAADKDLRVRMGLAAYNRFRLEFSAEKVARTITSLYRQLFESNRSLD
jgi:glycosyltransferase involved in cell wall biosynthesis